MINVNIDNISTVDGWIQHNRGKSNTIQSIELKSENHEAVLSIDFDSYDLWLKAIEFFNCDKITDARVKLEGRGFAKLSYIEFIAQADIDPAQLELVK